VSNLKCLLDVVTIKSAVVVAAATMTAEAGQEKFIIPLAFDLIYGLAFPLSLFVWNGFAHSKQFSL